MEALHPLRGRHQGPGPKRRDEGQRDRVGGLNSQTLENYCKQIRNYLQSDSIAWNLVADSAGQATALMDLYNVSELPLCYLIDKDKKILLKSENSLEVNDVLDELLGE